MRQSNPRILALAVAAIFSLLATLLFVVFGALLKFQYPWFVPVVASVVLFVSTYLVLYYVLEKFIYSRIKLIYKTIHTVKLKKEDKHGQALNIHSDIIGSVNKEVAEWDKSREEELEELRRMEIYRREFLGNVSHELKTPIFNIQGYILSLLDGALSDPEVNQRFLEKSQRNIERMIAIVEDLEIITKLETGEAVPVMTDFSIISLIREVFEMLEPEANEKNIRLFFAADYIENFTVEADKEKIRAVLINLIQNSIKYGIDGGRTKVSIYDMDENYLIEVSDNGAGIEEKYIPRLFERFYRVDRHRSRAQGGSGLGLAIVKHIIEAHNQTINVRSAPGVGSTFSFTLKKAGK